MAYSIHGHISYILEANSVRPNDFSLIGREQNEILQFKDTINPYYCLLKNTNFSIKKSND